MTIFTKSMAVGALLIISTFWASFTETPVQMVTNPISLPALPTLQPTQGNFSSPVINADQSVTLRLDLPSANAVTASGDIGEYSLTKNEENIWSVTTGPLEPAIYSYYFTVDGTQIADPVNPDKKSPTESLLTIPGNPPMPWEERDVPHGTVTPVTYTSKIFNAERRFYVYTPPGYVTGAEKLPVLYLLHGYTDDDSSWTAIGKANRIADNLLADGKIKPLIIIMPYGQLNADVNPDEAFSPEFQKNYEEQLIAEIMPSVEKSYRVKTDSRHRGMAGISMGGMQTAYIGMNHPEFFSTIGLWSSAIFDDPEVLLQRLDESSPKLKNSFAYIEIAVGEQDSLFSKSANLDEFLTIRNIEHEFVPTPGTHSWVLWRGYLISFLQKFSDTTE